MEPVTWAVLAASTATWAVKQLAGTTWKEKVEPVLARTGLNHELARAYEAAFKAFIDVLRGTVDGPRLTMEGMLNMGSTGWGVKTGTIL